MAHVLALYICPNQGMPMQFKTNVLALKGSGLDGDRYAQGKGAWSHAARTTIRHVTLIGQEAIEMANLELGLRDFAPFEPSETRRNILTSGIELNGLVGREFLVGVVLMRGVELADPCKRPSALVKKRGFDSAFIGRGGLRAEILTTGTILLGDDIRNV